MKSIAIFGTFDTKEDENLFLANQLRLLGIKPFMVDLGIRKAPSFTPDIPASTIALAGGRSLEELRVSEDKAESLSVMAKGAAAIARNLCETHIIAGVIAMGGGQGTYLSTIVMKALPIGFPKLIVSTVVGMTGAGACKFFAGTNDTMMMNSLVDVSGLNSIMKLVIKRAAAAIYGMVSTVSTCDAFDTVHSCPRIGISMWGVTTQCVNHIRENLELEGYEVFVFHANGLGGGVMETLAVQGFLDGLIDITLPEVSIPLAGGDYPVIADRLTKCNSLHIPRVISFGGMDMIRISDPLNIPAKFCNRKIYYHNAEIAFVRSNAQECDLFAKTVADRLRGAVGPISVLIPQKGTSSSDVEGGPLYDPYADRILFESAKKYIDGGVPVIELDCHINDPVFAELAANTMLKLLNSQHKAR